MSPDSISRMETAMKVYLCKTELKLRGWTDALIDGLLRAPDRTRPNPHCRSKPPMRLYLRVRVEQAEATEDWRAEQARRGPRRAAARRAVETKMRKTQQYAQGVEVKVPLLTRERLIRLACDHYNQRGGDFLAGPDSETMFLERICVNYLRHELTNYESHLGRIAGKVGSWDGYREIKGRVLDAIAARYAWLGEECARQRAAMPPPDPPCLSTADANAGACAPPARRS
jgi:hypothetical protein